jgi:hypothetical protein
MPRLFLFNIISLGRSRENGIKTGWKVGRAAWLEPRLRKDKHRLPSGKNVLSQMGGYDAHG